MCNKLYKKVPVRLDNIESSYNRIEINMKNSDERDMHIYRI